MKKMNLLSKAEMKKVMGGDDGTIGEIGGQGTFTSGSASCTSSTGNCKYLYCVSGSTSIAIGICCDDVKYKSSGDAGCSNSGETMECRS